MPPTIRTPHLQDPICAHLRTDVTSFPNSMTVDEVHRAIREHGLGERVIYFYATDEQGRLTGVVPTRRLLIADPSRKLADLMIRQVIAIPDSATVFDACEFFVMHKFLAFPVVDAARKLIGIVDVQIFTDEMFDLAERQHADAVFEALGFRVSQVKDAGPLRAFRFRFPWLLTTIGIGTACAAIASTFERTLSGSLILAFFMIMVLALGESVSAQSMTVTIQSLRSTAPTRRWFLRSLIRELATAALLGLACGLAVSVIVVAWRGETLPAVVIGGGIFLSLIGASVFGLSVPAVLHALKLDPRIAAGPLTLALTDLCTTLFYLSLAALVLPRGPGPG